MKCDEAIDLLSEYIDDELDDEQRKAVEAHIADCPKCRHELDALKATVQLVGSLSKAKAPQELASNVTKALEEEDRGTIIWPSARVVGSLLAAAAVLLVVSVTFLMQRPAPMESMAPAAKPAATPRPASEEARELEEEAPVAEKAVEKSFFGATAKKEAGPGFKADGVAEDRETDRFQYADKVRRHRRATQIVGAKDAKESTPAKTIALAKPESKASAASAEKAAEPSAAAPPAIAEGVRMKKAAGKIADRDQADVGRLEETKEDVAGKLADVATNEAEKKPSAIAPARGVAKTKAEAEALDESMALRRAPSPPRLEAKVAKAKERDLGVRSKLAPVETQTAPAPEPARPVIVGKAGGEVAAKGARGPAPEAELRTIVIRSRDPQADMARVQSLLQSKYMPETKGDVRSGRLDAPMQQVEPAHRIQTTIAANRIDALLGDLKRLKLAAVPGWGQDGQAAGLMKQQRFAQKLEQAAPTPETIHLTILFQQAE